MNKGSKKIPIDVIQKKDEKETLQHDETERNMTPDNEWTVLTDKKQVDVTVADRPGRF